MIPLKTPSLRLHKPSGRAGVTLAGRDHSCGPWGTKQAPSSHSESTTGSLGSGVRAGRGWCWP